MTTTARALFLLLFAALASHAQHAGSGVCRGCHPDKYLSQSKTGHARALAAASEGSPGQWAFGAGEKATTWVSQRDEETLLEHGLSYYAATKSKGLTPGHETPADAVYRTFDAVGTALRCFRCHSTGPVNIDAGYRITPSEPGVRCEAGPGPGGRHASAKGAAGTILNPKRLGAAGMNALCGACHRQASELDDDTDWTNAWNVRHQPSYLHRAACFRNSNGALTCITCHNPHEPLLKAAAAYDAKCSGCHRGVTHKTAPGSRTCVGCHMPQVAVSPALTFTNHWIGIYDKGNALVPARRVVKTLKAAAAVPSGIVIPSDPATLVPVYEKALAQREAELGPTHPRVARAASDLGLFLKQTGSAAAAEAPLRKALQADRANSDPNIDSDRESLASVLEATGKQEEAGALYREAANGRDARVAARSLTSLAKLDPAGADTYYRRAIQAEEAAFGKYDRRVAVLLHELALTLRASNDDRSAEPLLRRALKIQQDAPQPDFHMTVAVMNTLGNLLEGAGQMDEAERLERDALRLSERKFGPESAELSMTCTNLADVLWNKKDFEGAAQLYRRALAADTALYGPERTETAADFANLGMLLKEAGQPSASDALLRRALAIYEKLLGPDSAQARFVREGLTRH
jgi:tetratricopeptide (TPR) repeat protein